MVRHSTFDPTDPERFEADRQRFDWALLRSGPIARYTSAFDFAAAQHRLRGLGYRVHLLDAADWSTTQDLHEAVASALDFPSWYGRNLDALNDLLSDVGSFRLGGDDSVTGTVFAIDHFDQLTAIDRHTAVALLDIIADHSRFAGLLGHAMLCLIATDDATLGKVGGSRVYAGPTWDVEPDPPVPFTGTDVAYIVFQAVADASGADRAVAALRPLLEQFDRVQVPTPQQATREEASNFYKYDSQVRDEGASVYRIGIGIRGTGDLEQLWDELDTRLRSVGYNAESFGSVVHDPPPDHPVFDGFPGLRRPLPVPPGGEGRDVADEGGAERAE
ncbi:barstar family protein [Prescottella sp. R16]|uniref:barstar family protein n=1 Tax=Prescottella sp. R16 TaxID=3064529 RepID=UPI00272E4404|nr:barstar family protein [Prescottella sp. R16]